VGFCEDPKCIITQLYKTDLHKYVHNKSLELPPEMALHFALDISLGMKAVHSAGFVHRDLKTPNILLENLTFNGQTALRAVICDFGIARVVHAITLEKQKFMVIQGLSPRYTAPEVFERMRKGTAVGSDEEMMSDIYSFGSIVWEMVTREKPWDACQSFQEIDQKVCRGEREPLPPNTSNNVMIEALKGLITACWAQTPFERPTFGQISAKLNSFL